jgi:hypothetical protein
MGRGDTLTDNPAEPVRLSLVALDWIDGDYDKGGAYWGCTPGTAIYRAVGESDSFDCIIELFVRAGSRTEAKDMIRKKLPGATFYR